MKHISQHKTDILKIEPLDIDSTKKNDLKKIGNKNLLFSQIPTLFATEQLSGAYKVIMPPGVSGQLMQYKDGLLGTPILKDGKVVGHSGLKSMSSLVTPMLIFTAMSIVTGQYFLSQINKSLSEILDEVKKIKDLFLLKEESNLFSHGIFLPYFNNSEQLKSATIGNIQRVINELSASAYFYSNNIIHLLNSIEKTGINGELSVSEIKQNLEKLKVSLELRNIFIVMEFAFSHNFDSTTIDNVKNNIINGNIEVFTPLVERVILTNEIMKKNLVSEAKTLAKQKKLKCFIKELHSLKIGIGKRHIEESNVKIDLAFDRLKKIDESGGEFYIIGDEVYTRA